MAAAGPRCQSCPSQRKLVGARRHACQNTAQAAPTPSTVEKTSQAAWTDHAEPAQHARVKAVNAIKATHPHRHTPKRRTVIWKEGGACMTTAEAESHRGGQMRLNTRVPLVPPKPKLFFTA